MRFAPFVFVGLVHLYALFTGDEQLANLTKPLLMIALLLGFLSSLPTLRSRIALFGSLAIVFSWLGDVSLASPGDLGFLIGLGCFLCAHVFYLWLLSRVIPLRRPSKWAWLFVAWWIAFVLILAAHAGALLAPIAVYGAVLGAVAAAALGCNRWVAVGALVFLASDSLLGLHMFLPAFDFWQVDFTIMFFYLAGQGLIAWGAVVEARKNPVPHRVVCSPSGDVSRDPL